MIKKLTCILFAAFAALPLFAQQNVILLIADDMGTDYLGFYEDAQDTAKVPNIRSLLSRGVRFQNAWSYPICSPARAAMLTGRYAFRTGVGTVITGPSNGQLDTSEITIGKLLKTLAPVPYATANIGKWHLHTATPANRNNPAVMGYDHYAGNFIGQVNDYYNWAKIVDGAPAVTVTNYATTEQVDDAIEWLDGLDPNKPFFLWQAFNAPHFPYHLPPANLHSVPGLTGTTQDIMQHRPEYYKAMIEAMDTEIGRLFAWLEQHNQLENTNIIFIGDNGNDAQISQIDDAAHHKGTIYEYGVHVPMIIAGPAVLSPNRVSDALVSTTDLFATILEMAGVFNWKSAIPANKPVDAISLLPLVRNEASAVRTWLFTEIFDPNPQPEDGKAVRDYAYKLLRFDDGHEEFYKILDDPQEQQNLLLQPALTAEGKINYNYLCEKLSTLLGSPVCEQIVGTQNPDSEVGDLQLFPNPAGHTLNLSNATEKAWTTLSITDALGRDMGAFSKPANGILDISTLPNGVYFLKLTGQHGVVGSGRFVKKQDR